MYLSTASLLLYDSADKKRTIAARANARAQRAVSAGKKHFSLKKGCSLQRGRRLCHSTLTDFRRLRKGASTRPSRLELGLTFRTLPHKKMAPTTLTKTKKSLALFQGPEPQEGEWLRSRCGKGGGEKSASSAKTNPTEECTQTRRLKLKHGRSLEFVGQSRPAGYGPSQCHHSLAVPAAFKRTERCRRHCKASALNFASSPGSLVFDSLSPSKNIRLTYLFKWKKSSFWKILFSFAERINVVKILPWQVGTRPASGHWWGRCISMGWMPRYLRTGCRSCPPELQQSERVFQRLLRLLRAFFSLRAIPTIFLSSRLDSFRNFCAPRLKGRTS